MPVLPLHDVIHLYTFYIWISRLTCNMALQHVSLSFHVYGCSYIDRSHLGIYSMLLKLNISLMHCFDGGFLKCPYQLS